MQNQSSPVQILSPVIPSSWCPSGSFADIFNSYNQLYLNNSTVNIPGLNQVTPQQIQTINQNIQNLQNTISAFAGKSGSQAIGHVSTAQTFPITFSSPMPSSSYQISINFVSTSGTFNAAASWAVLSGSQTTSGFTAIVYSNNTDIVSFNWSVFTAPSS